MDSQDHKMTTTSAGHEGHGVHLCHRCGWPFPNPHPSAKHRRAHKKVCGTIEGYKIINSEEHDDHLAVSDDENGSDENEHTPSPILPNKTTEYASASGGVGGKSTKSEDDVFSDAVTEFSDSGVSSRLEKRLESVRGVDMNAEEKGVESDLHVNELKKVDENAGKAKKFDNPSRSDETSNPGAPETGNDQSGSVTPITNTSAEAVSVGLVNGLQSDAKSEIPRDVVIDDVNECGDGANQGKEDKLASVFLDSEEGKISDKPVSEAEKMEELCDKSVSQSVEHVSPPQDKIPQNSDASVELKSVAHSFDGSTGAVGEIRLAEKTHENIDSSVGVKEVFDFTEDIPSVNPSSAGELSDTVSIDKEVVLVGGEKAGNFDENENQNVESKDNINVETVSTHGSADDTSVREHDRTTVALKNDGDHCEETSEKGKVASVEEVKVLPDSTASRDNSTDFPSSNDARNLEELSRNESGSLGSRDNGIEKSVEELGTCKVTEVLQSVDSELGDNKDVLNESSPPTVISDDPTSPAILELPKNVHAINNNETVTDNEVAVSERTPEEPVPKESIPLFTDSESLSKNSAHDNSCIGEVTKASESVATEVIAKQNSKGPTSTMQESLPVQKCLNETPPGVEEKNLIEDITASKSIDVVPREKLSDKCLKDLHETSAAVDDKDINIVERASGVDTKSLENEVKQKDDVFATDLSSSSCSISDSLEGNFGSVSDTVENNSQKQKTTAEEADPNKPDDLEPPSFMTLVESRGGGDKVTAASEIETGQHNQQLKSDALQAGWFPSLTNVVNESEGRKKNEEMIAKVTNWSPVKHHGPLKNLLTEVKSPNEKQVPAASGKPKDEPEMKDNGAGATTVSSILGPDAPPATNKDVEEWNSPARYPIEVKKEKKKKGKPYWVPFVCCSSVHRDL